MAEKTKFWHKHPVNHVFCFQIKTLVCCGCTLPFSDDYSMESAYKCHECEMGWHYTCAPDTEDNIEIPCHPRHPLELLVQGPPTYSDGICNLCERKLFSPVYHCKTCDFSVHLKCASKPLPLTVYHAKCHGHALTLLATKVSFNCNACGTLGSGSPYVCLSCFLMFHNKCIDLPHVININRHEHRVSHHAHPFSAGDNPTCEICRKGIDWRYGAYSCQKCPDYFVHSLCATRKDVWDGEELEDVPEEEEDTAAFSVIEEGVINHFSHKEHNLSLVEDGIIGGGCEGMLCKGCSRPILFDERYYNCMDCEFMLHERCANLPMKKRHWMSTQIFSLSFHGELEEGEELFLCSACGRGGSGFRYCAFDRYGTTLLDVHCASLFSFQQPKLHPHTLFLTTLEAGSCVSCGKTETYVLRCEECEYSLDLGCATLPVRIKHRCDDHYLILSSGEKATGKYWCEVCEAELDPEKWFYTCHDCGVVCHIKCVIGDSLNIMPGVVIEETEEEKREMVLNNQNTRPICSNCGSRCRYPMLYTIFYISTNDFFVFCSINCCDDHLNSI